MNRAQSSLIEENQVEENQTPPSASELSSPSATRPERMVVRYEALLRLCQDVFADACYDASYHALAAAMHCAQDLGDTERLEAVEVLATKQMEHIDTADPQYYHSTQSATGQGNPSLLTTLARQAHTQGIIIR